MIFFTGKTPSINPNFIKERGVTGSAVAPPRRLNGPVTRKDLSPCSGIESIQTPPKWHKTREAAMAPASIAFFISPPWNQATLKAAW